MLAAGWRVVPLCFLSAAASCLLFTQGVDTFLLPLLFSITAFKLVSISSDS